MHVVMIVSATVALWIAVALVVISLCRAAKRGDEVMDTAFADPITSRRDAESPGRRLFERPLRTLSLDHAATLLDVNPETVLAWEARYGFPTSSPSERRYNRSEVLALRDSLDDGLSIASAVVRAREQTKRSRTAATSHLTDRRDSGRAS